jgi:predicted nucleotidyltransferase
VIPKRRRDGTLPPGIYQATIDEILTTYPPVNQQRQILNDSLQRAIEELRKLDPSLVIFVDGSYVTRKAEPNDVDLLIVTTRLSARRIIGYLDQVCPVEAVSLDITVEPALPNVVFDLFTETRRGQSKGIIRLL